MPDFRAEKVAEQSSGWLKRNVGLVAAGGGLLVIIAAVLVYGAISREREDMQAQLLYDNLPDSPQARKEVLSKLVFNYPDTKIGTLARLDYGQELYREGSYPEAESEFKAVLAKRGAQDVYGQRAQLGLAYCAQQMKEYDKARKLYQEIKDGGGVYASEAQRMLKELENPPEIPSGAAAPSGETPTGQVPAGTPPAGTVSEPPQNPDKQ